MKSAYLNTVSTDSPPNGLFRPRIVGFSFTLMPVAFSSSGRLNPFNIYVSSTSIFNSAERTQRPLIVTIFGKNCFRKLQRKVSWTAPVGTRVLRLKDFIHEEDPASLRLRDTPWRKYFRFDAKSDYLVLRKSLLRLQENTLMELMACLSKKYATSPYTLTILSNPTPTAH